MGRGNACVNRDYEGLFYIDNDDLEIWQRYIEDEDVWEIAYRRDIGDENLMNGWTYASEETKMAFDNMVYWLRLGVMERFPSFYECDEWVSHDEHAVLENNLFYIVLEDSGWSFAVKLIRKDGYYLDLTGLQKKHYQQYLDGIRDVLFEHYDTLGVYRGAWTHGRISKKDYVKEDEVGA